MTFIAPFKRKRLMSLSKLKRFICVLLAMFCLAFHASSAQAQVLSFRLKWMLGKQNTFDGPNCLNATAYTLGFTPYLTQTSGAELKYYMETSCQQVSTPEAQDVVIINREGTAEHSAIILDKETIFEKLSTTGFISGFEDKYESIYKKSAIRDSSYIKNCLSEPKKCVLQYYRCQSQSAGMAKVRECENTEVGQAILKVKSLQQAYAFTQNRDYSIGANKARIEMLKLQKYLNNINLNDQCALYSLAQIESLLWQDSSIQHFDSQNKTGWLKSGIMETSQELVDTSEFRASFYEKIEQLKPQLKKIQMKKTVRELTQ